MALSHSISCISPFRSLSLSSSSSIHPDYTSNGSSSQQPPTVMELCLNEQPCLHFSLFLSSLFSLFLTLMHTLNSSHFHLQKDVCTISTLMHLTLLGHIGKKRRKQHCYHIFRFRVFILCALVRGWKRTNTAEAPHIYPIVQHPIQQEG